MKRKSAFIAFLLIASVGIFANSKGKLGLNVELGYGSEIGELNNLGYLQVFVTPQYNITDNFWVGTGMGYLHLSSRKLKESPFNKYNLLPVYAATGYKFKLGGNIAPFASLKAGYGIMNKKIEYTLLHTNEEYQEVKINTKGGFFVTPTIGIENTLQNGMSLSLSVNYILKQTISEYNYGKDSYSGFQSGLGFLLGFRF